MTTDRRQTLSQDIKEEALRLGFSACGIAEARPVSDNMRQRFLNWIAQGGNADMQYMGNHTPLRLDPRGLMSGLKSLVCVAMNYTPPRNMPEGELQLAAYALGNDYHDVVKSRLHQLAEHIAQRISRRAVVAKQPEGNEPEAEWDDAETMPYRVFCDSGPILERYWAEQAGLGWTGRNHQLIIPRAGSMFFLGELLLPLPLYYDAPMPNGCGNCHRCVDACPTKALSTTPFQAEKCLSYQLIENRSELSEEARRHMGDTIYGCDRCQQACPWNRFATPNSVPELQPNSELLDMTREKWSQLSAEDFRRLFKGSAVKRVKYEGLKRNIAAQHDAEAARNGNTE